MTALVSCFFSYFSFAHIWDEKVVRQAIAVGIKNRTFAYVANARKDEQSNLLFGGSSTTSVQFGKDVPISKIDVGEGAFLLSAAYATQLLTPPSLPKVELVTTPPTISNESQPGQRFPHPYALPQEGSKTVINETPTSTIPTAQLFTMPVSGLPTNLCQGRFLDGP